MVSPCGFLFLWTKDVAHPSMCLLAILMSFMEHPLTFFCFIIFFLISLKPLLGEISLAVYITGESLPGDSPWSYSMFAFSGFLSEARTDFNWRLFEEGLFLAP